MNDPFGDLAPEPRETRSADVGSKSAPQVDALLVRLRHMIDGARDMPLSASSMINKEEVLSLIDDLSVALPDELRSARWLLKERDEFLGQVRNEGDDILEAARIQAEQMVQRTEVVRSAEQRARQILEKAEADARKMKREAEDYCDQKLGSFEIVLQRTLGVVGAGRAKLQGNPLGELAEDGLAMEDQALSNYAPHSDPGVAPFAPPAAPPAPMAPPVQHLDPMTGRQQATGGGFFDQESE